MPKASDRERKPVKIDENDPRVGRWAAITELAVRECGTLDQARVWMNTPKVALKGKTPIEAMITEKGCKVVEDLLRQLNQ